MVDARILKARSGTIRIAAAIIFFMTIMPARAADSALTLTDFLDYLRLLGYEEIDPVLDTATGHPRMRFSVYSDYGFTEVHELETATEPLDPRKTGVYENLGDLWGEIAPHCRAKSDTPPLSLPYATHEEKLDYIARYVIKQRQFNFVLLIDNCVAEADLIAPHVARLRHDFSHFTPERYWALKDETARVEELRRILLLPIPEEYSRAMQLIETIATEKLVDREIIDAIERMRAEIAHRSAELDRKLGSIRAARDEMLYRQSFDTPPALTPRLERVDTEGFVFRVSLVNTGSETVVTNLHGGFLSLDAGNVLFDFWLPGQVQPVKFIPFRDRWIADLISTGPFLIPPGGSISHDYDLSKIVADTGCTHFRARIAYRGSVTNFVEACRDTAPRPLPDHIEVAGSHKVTISRRWSNETEARMLAIAENMPARAGGDTAWWCGSFDGALIAKAITADAVRYYLDLTDDFRRGDFSGTKGIAMTSSRFSYEATVSDGGYWSDSPSNRFYVVTMTMRWYQYCGGLCAMGFELTRKVILDHDGNVIGVEGDGCPPVEVS